MENLKLFECTKTSQIFMKIYSITTASFIPRVRFVAYHCSLIYCLFPSTCVAHNKQFHDSQSDSLTRRIFRSRLFSFAIISNYVPMIYVNYIFHPPETRAELEDNKSEGKTSSAILFGKNIKSTWEADDVVCWKTFCRRIIGFRLVKKIFLTIHFHSF